MGLFDHFPYTNVHELNLDWILSMMKALEAEWEAFTAGNSLQFANPMLHDVTKTYAKNTIVLDADGNAYVSLQAVPVGVGLQNGDYWLMVFDYEAFIEKVNKNFTANYYRGSYRATAAMAIGDWLTVDDILYKATAAIAVDDILENGVNITHFTLEDFIKAFMQSANQLIQQYKNDIDASELAYRTQLANDVQQITNSLQAQLDAAISGATADSEVINARVGWDSTTYSTLGEAIRTQITELHMSKATNDDFEFGSGGFGGGSISYIFGSRNRVRNKFKITNSRIQITADAGYSMLIGTANSTLYNGSGTYDSVNVINEEVLIILRISDDAMIKNFDEFLSHYQISVDVNHNEYIKPSDNVIHFQVPVNVNNPTLGASNYTLDSLTINYDNGIVILPENYDPVNRKSRLAIVCHGAGVSPYPGLTIDSNGKILGDPQRVLNKMGFVVMDMYANPYSFAGTTDGLHYGNPVSTLCYIQGYEYIKKHYNIYDEIFVTGSSMGGLTAMSIVNNTQIPVLAQALFAPVVDLFKQAWCYPWGTPDAQREQLATLYHFTGTTPTWTNNRMPSQEEIDYYLDNVDKTVGFTPILSHGVGKTQDELAAEIPSSATAMPSAVPDERDIYAGVYNDHKVPIKIWHCMDDASVPFRYSMYMNEAIKRFGGISFLRYFSTGGHTAWAAGEDTNMVDVEGNTFSCKASQKECWYFLNRYDVLHQ